jgi:DNA helicase IV
MSSKVQTGVSEFLPDDFQSEERYLKKADELLVKQKQNIQNINDQYNDVQRGGTHQAKFERDATVYKTAYWLTKFNIGDKPLCFGRIDTLVGDSVVVHNELSTTYIGRLSIHDAELNPIVVDWRAPIASPFYQATTSNNLNVARRRSFLIEKAKLIRLNDDLLVDKEKIPQLDLHLEGEAALINSLNKKRTGRMGDIVSTIQKEQDEIIRDDLNKTILVTGGPGTGKTVVVLHRIAYLLFTYREKLSRQKTLIIGPSNVFLKYIEEVLPSLGEDEDAVQLSTVNTIRKDLNTSRGKGTNLTLKGDPTWRKIIQCALDDRYRHLNVNYDVWVDGIKITVKVGHTKKWVKEIDARKGKYNAKRRLMVKKLLKFLTKRYLEKVEQGIIETSSTQKIKNIKNPPYEWVEEFKKHLRSNEDVKRILERTWPILSGKELIYDLFSMPPLLNSAIRKSNVQLTTSEIEACYIPRQNFNNQIWERGDVALIDEADFLLGDPLDAVSEKVRIKKLNVSEHASAILDSYGIKGYMSEQQLTNRYNQEHNQNDGLSASDKDNEYFLKTFGYLVVDEAQDLTPMEWRMCARRCPSKRATIVGDLNQRSFVTKNEIESWEETLKHFHSKNVSKKVLNVNYRTPKQITEYAIKVAKPKDVTSIPISIREIGESPRITSQTLDQVLEEIILDSSIGTIAVISEEVEHSQLKDQITENPKFGDIVGIGKEGIDNRIALLSASQCKGLEFDAVLVNKPSKIESANDIYVVCTRATKMLIIIEDKGNNNWWSI